MNGFNISRSNSQILLLKSLTTKNPDFDESTSSRMYILSALVCKPTNIEDTSPNFTGIFLNLSNNAAPSPTTKFHSVAVMFGAGITPANASPVMRHSAEVIHLDKLTLRQSGLLQKEQAGVGGGARKDLLVAEMDDLLQIIAHGDQGRVSPRRIGR